MRDVKKRNIHHRVEFPSACSQCEAAITRGTAMRWPTNMGCIDTGFTNEREERATVLGAETCVDGMG